MQMDVPKVQLAVTWLGPTTYGEFTCFPKQRGVYAVLLRSDEGLQMVRMGATRDARRRPANYDKKPFELEPRLMIAFCNVPALFTDAMSSLIQEQYPQRLEDVDWLEYRMEHKFLEIYCNRFGSLPPANFQRGSKREYAHHIDAVECGALHVLKAPPAQLSDEVRHGLRQSGTRLSPH